MWILEILKVGLLHFAGKARVTKLDHTNPVNHMKQWSKFGPSVRPNVDPHCVSLSLSFFTGSFFLLIWITEQVLHLYLVHHFNLIVLALLYLDFICLLYSCFNTCRTVLFYLHEIFLFRCLFTGHLAQLHAHLRDRVSGREVQSVHQLMGHLAFYQTEHAHLHLYEQYLNRKIISRTLSAAFLIKVLVNVMALNFLLISQMTLFERAIVLAVTLFQIAIGLLISQTLISMVAPLYACERTLYRAQGKLASAAGTSGQRILGAKVRLMTFFECICTEEQFAFTAGVLASISKKAVFEVGHVGSSYVALFF